MKYINLAFIIYYLFITILGYFIIIIDKNRAKRNEWRIPEKRIWVTAVLGGGAGVWFAMKKVRHKTKRRSFVIGVPLLIFFHIAIIIVALY